MNPLSQNNMKLTNTKFKCSFNPSKTNITLNYVKGPSPYRAVNTFNLSFTNHSANAAQRNNRCLFSDPYNV